MKSKFRTLMVNLLELSTIFCLASCATTMTIPKEIDIAATEVRDKIPLKAALYLSQGFRNAKYLMWGETVPVGDALCHGSETIIKNIFREMIVLGSTDVLSPKSSEVIVTPEVVSLEMSQCPSVFLKGMTCSLNTVIKWNIVSPEGKEIYASTVRSDQANIYRIGNPRKIQPQFIEMSLKNNFQKAQEDIYTNAWWKTHWWKKGDQEK